MISREEAKRKSIMCSNKSMCCEGLVREIYDSIGSCGECAYYKQSTAQSKIKEMVCFNDNIDADGGRFIPPDIMFFCKYFERKEDDNNNSNT